MQRGRAGIAGGFDSLISTGKELFGSKLSATPGSILSAARFRGKLGAAIAVITSLIVGFLAIELFRKPACCHSACNDVGKCQTAMLLSSS